MSSRALSLATVMLLIGCFAVGQARAQVQNLEAGKSPSQIFAGTCSACHKSPRGLLKTVPPGSLASFLRQHYTTSPDMANVLSSYLASNGVNDTRYNGAQSKGGKDSGKDGTKDAAREARSEPKPDARSPGPPDQLDRFGRRQRPPAAIPEPARPEPEPRQAARPEAEEAPSQAEPAARPGRNGRRLARPAEPPEEAARPNADGQVPAQASRERGPDGRKLSAKQKLSKRGRPGGEDVPKDSSKDPFKEFFRDQPKADSAGEEPSGAEPPKSDTAKVDPVKPDSSKSDSSLPEGTRPSADGPSPSAKVETPRDGDAPALRPDAAPPAASVPSSGSAPTASAAQSGGSEAAPAPPAVASAPPAPAPAPAGPPTPPISQ
jgi:hypothetical protein